MNHTSAGLGIPNDSAFRRDALVATLHPIWLKSEARRLSRKGRKRAIGGGMSYHLEFAEQLLLSLMYYRTYTNGPQI